MATQDPNKFQGNQRSTDTTNIAPGDPMWTTGDEHNQQSFGWGYDYHDPVSLMKGKGGEGGYKSGNAAVRFGKFGFHPDNVITGVTHGSVFELPILREEGQTGRYTIVIKEKPRPFGIPTNGELGTIDDVEQYRYGTCKSDVDLYTLNKPYLNADEQRWREANGYFFIPGLVWDGVSKELRLTFESGEKLKRLKCIAPYRAETKEMLAAKLRERQTYYIQEYNAIRANTKTGNYYEQPGSHHSNYSIASDPNDLTSQISNHWHWYYCYTLPMPVSWIKNVQGNYVYINNWDPNYKYRVINNTERKTLEANRPDDTTDPDEPGDGYIIRYDHTDKLNLVKGKTRFSRFALRRKGNPKWPTNQSAKYSNNAYGWAPTSWDATWSGHGTYNKSGNLNGTSDTTHGCDSFPVLHASGFGCHSCWCGSSWPRWRCRSQGQCSRTDVTYPNTVPNTSLIEFAIPNNAEPFEYRVLNSMDPSDPASVPCTQRWRGTTGHYRHNHQENPARDPGNFYSGNWSRNWISNDTRVTHRTYPEYPNAAMVGILGLKREVIEGRVDSNQTTGLTSLDHWELQRHRLWPRPAAEDAAAWEQRWIPLPQSTANGVKWTRSTSPACPTLKYINEQRHNNPGSQYEDFYDDRETEETHPEAPWNALVGYNNHSWGTIEYENQSWYESSRMDMDDGDPDKAGNSNFSDPLDKAVDTGTLPAGEWYYTAAPADRTFSYGIPGTEKGDLAQPMFNHMGATETDFAPFGVVIGSTYVMSSEDPSSLKSEYDYPSHGGSTFDPDDNNLKGAHNIQYHWQRHLSPGVHCSSGCAAMVTDYSVRNNYQLTFPNLGGWHSIGSDLGDWTNKWITVENNSLLSAGKLDSRDLPLTVQNPDGSNNDYFDGYRWDGKQEDTSAGTTNPVLGDGSPGNGEGGKSRYLWDHHHLVHPLSSYDKNDTNLKGYYQTCIDHVDRILELKMYKDDLFAEYDLGVTDIKIDILKAGELVEPDKWARYDFRVLADHFIYPGPTYQDNDGWERSPTAASLNQRMFMAGPAGVMLADPASPVLFLGVSAGNLPGGTPTSRYRVIPPKPAKLRLTATDTDTKNVYANGVITDGPLRSDSHYITTKGMLACLCNTNVAEEKTYKFSFKNVGEVPMEIAFSNTYERFLGPAYVEDNQPDACTNPGCGVADVATGDKLDDWTPATDAIKYSIDSTGNTPTDGSGNPTHRRGVDGFTNTASLSADERIVVEYDVKVQTGNKQGYFFAHNYTLDFQDGTSRTGKLVFKVRAKH